LFVPLREHMQLPNVGGFFFGCVQMVLYCCYRKPAKPSVVLPTTAATAAAESAEMELPLAALGAVAVLPTCAAPVLADLQKLEEAVGSPRKAGIKAT
jgi:solute carrier family 50 protein (sugar transporter)